MLHKALYQTTSSNLFIQALYHSILLKHFIEALQMYKAEVEEQAGPEAGVEAEVGP